MSDSEDAMFDGDPAAYAAAPDGGAAASLPPPTSFVVSQDDDTYWALWIALYTHDPGIPPLLELTPWGEPVMLRSWVEAVNEGRYKVLDDKHPALHILFWRNRLQHEEWPSYVDIAWVGMSSPGHFLSWVLAEKAVDVIEPAGEWDEIQPVTYILDKGKAYRPPPALIHQMAAQGTPVPADQLHLGIHPSGSFALPQEVDVRYLHNIPVTVPEIATFFPYHFKWGGLLTRILDYTDSWTMQYFILLFMRARDLHGHGYAFFESHYSRVQKFSKVLHEKGDFAARPAKVDYTFMNCTPPTTNTKARAEREIVTPDVFVRDIPAGVPRKNFPTGNDKGPLTCAIEYVLDHPSCHYLRMSDLWDFTHKKLFHLKCHATYASDRNQLDIESFQRHKADLEAYRKEHALFRPKKSPGKKGPATKNR